MCTCVCVCVYIYRIIYIYIYTFTQVTLIWPSWLTGRWEPMGCFHSRDAQALFSPIHHHLSSQSAPSSHLVQRIVFYLSFQFSKLCVTFHWTALLASVSRGRKMADWQLLMTWRESNQLSLYLPLLSMCDASFIIFCFLFPHVSTYRYIDNWFFLLILLSQPQRSHQGDYPHIISWLMYTSHAYLFPT